MKHPAVQDRFGLVYGILVMLGIGTLLPWNVMITEKEFFDVRLHVEPADARIAGNFLSLFGLTFNTANLLAFCAVACLHSSRLSLRAQIVPPLFIILALLAATAGVALRTDLPGIVVARCALPTLAALGACMAVLQGGVLNLACLFPPIYIQGFVVGAGLSGVGTSVLSFVTQLRASAAAAGDGGDGGGPIGPDPSGAPRTAADVAPAAFAYFTAAASVTALCAMAFTALGRLEFSRARLLAHYAAVRRAHHIADDEDGGGGGGGALAARGAYDSLLGTPYDENTPEEGEPLPACERYWPAALIPYMHPATLAAEASPYWEADPLAEEGGDGAGAAAAAALLEAGRAGGANDNDAWSDDVGGGAGGTDVGNGGGNGGGGVLRTPSYSPLPRGPSSSSSSAPVAVPGGGRTPFASYPLGSFGGAGYAAASYDSAGGLAAPFTGEGGSFRCGTALRFYRSGSAGALRGVLEAAAVASGSGGGGSGGGGGGMLQGPPPPLRYDTPSRLASNDGALVVAPASGTPRADAAPGTAPSPFSAPRPSSQQRSLVATVPLPPPQQQQQQQPAAAAKARRPPGGRDLRAVVASAPAGPSRAPPAEARLKQSVVRGSGGAGGGGAARAAGQARGTAAFVTYAVSIVVCMAGSLAVWPGVTAFICSAHNPALVSPCAPRAAPYGRLAGDLFVPLMFVVYALGDVTGRVASGWGPWGRRPPAAAALLVYSVARLGIVGALLLCHVVTPAPWLLPWLLRGDAWPMGLVAALGLTQGHLLSTACMHAPAVLPPGKEARFGPVTGLCITAGCLAGSVVSTALVERFTSTGALGLGLGVGVGVGVGAAAPWPPALL